MTAPIGPLGSSLSSNFTQIAQRAQDSARAIVVPVFPGSGNSGNSGTIGGAADVGDVGPSFKDTFTRAMNEVTDARTRGADLAKRFVDGEPVELHTVMAASAEAGLALDIAIEMRNKVIEAYRALINMQS